MSDNESPDIKNLVLRNLTDGGTLNLENRKIGDVGAAQLANLEALTKATSLELGTTRSATQVLPHYAPRPTFRNSGCLT